LFVPESQYDNVTFSPWFLTKAAADQDDAYSIIVVLRCVRLGATGLSAIARRRRCAIS
jgi:hypothetical protein